MRDQVRLLFRELVDLPPDEPWNGVESPDRQAIARGEAIFNARTFVVDGVRGLNGGPGDPIAGPIRKATCTLCHDAPNAGDHSVALALNLGVADASRRTLDQPLYTLQNRTTDETVQTSDPGRAMITGRWADVGKFKGRSCAASPRGRRTSTTAPRPR